MKTTRQEFCVQYRCLPAQDWFESAGTKSRLQKWAQAEMDNLVAQETAPNIEYRVAVRIISEWEAAASDQSSSVSGVQAGGDA